MSNIKTEQEIKLMRQACELTKETLNMLEKHVKPNITTKQLDKLAHDFIISRGATPSFLGYEGYPASICASVNEEVVHGIPSDRVLKEGDIISIDVGAYLNGFHGDAARTFAVGKISEEHENLIKICRESFYEGIKDIKHGSYTGDIGHAIQTYAEKHGYTIVRELTGHGVGREMHESPHVPNYGSIGSGSKLVAGMTIAVEPMINLGQRYVEFLSDGWTVATADKLASAHYENTILITEDGVEILTV